MAPHFLCLDKKHLIRSTEAILSAGGEGIVLRKHASLYQHGITQQLIKFKAARRDQEALVLAIDSAYARLKLYVCSTNHNFNF